MNKTIVFLTLLGLCLFLSACKKNWTCECSLNDGTTLYNNSIAIHDATKTKAISKCNDHADEMKNQNKNISCKLK